MGGGRRCARDDGRGATYAAESVAFGGTDLEDLHDLDVLRAVARRVTAGRWWNGPVVDVRPARVDAASSSASSQLDARGQVVVRISAPQANLATLVHELAHALAGVEHGHDSTFRRAMLDVIDVVTNLDSTDRRRHLHVDALADACAQLGLDVSARRWPAPPPSGAIAL
jgi:hypothetical protein